MSPFQYFFSHIVSANQQSGFFKSGISTVNTQSVDKTSNSIIVEILFNNTILPRKKTSMANITSEIWKFA